MIAHGLSRLAFASVLDGLVAAGLAERRCAQRLDSMQVFGLVSRLSRLECVRESLRLALQWVEAKAAASLRPALAVLHLPALKIQIPLADIYARVSFRAAPVVG